MQSKTLIAVIVIVVLILVGFMFIQSQQSVAPAPIPPEDDEAVFCTMDAFQCPDGSYVGRTGPNCEFVCPE